MLQKRGCATNHIQVGRQVLLAPAGVVACFRPLTDASLFLLLYGVTAVYFSGVMVRRRSPWLAMGACEFATTSP